MISRIVMASVIGLSLTGMAMADTGPLKGPALKRTLSNKTLHLNTPLGVTMPIKFRRNGTMIGRAKPALARYTGSKYDKGVWWIKGNRVCQKWRRWLSGRSYCFSLHMRGRMVYWRRNYGRTGTGIISQ